MPKVLLEQVSTVHVAEFVNEKINFFANGLSNVSVNSNWINAPPPPGNPRETFLSERIPATRIIYFVSFSAPGQKMMVKFPGMGQNFPKLEETAPQACKKSFKN